ncbi:MAG: preprotein translocase subunit SecY, partial [Pseudomonadota bacterium]
KATELKQRLWFVIGALVVACIGSDIPVPGIDAGVLAKEFANHAGGVLGMFNMFSGGALGRMSIFALAIMPYITASIIFQLMTIMVPQIAALKKEGESGRRKINQYTRYATVVLAFVQGYGIAVGLEHTSPQAIIEPGMFFRFTTAMTLLGGTMFLMWLGEQITARGIGNGTSLIIFVGIVAGFPAAIANTLELGRTGALPVEIILLIGLIALGLIAFIVFIERAQRRILVQYPKRQVGMKMMGGETSHLPLKLNMAGVIPVIFASSILSIPLTVAGFNQGSSSWWTTVASYIGHGQPLYIILFTATITFFSFFYASIQFNSVETADNLKKYGGFIAGIRPGKNTADYLDYILTRLTVIGAIYLSFVCTVPEILIANYKVPFYLGGTSLLIIVNVLMDFVTQVQSHLFAHQYEGLIKKSKLKGKR